MDKETCAYCLDHVWNDEKMNHRCLQAGGAGEMSCDGTCDRFRKDRRGTYGTELPENIIDLAEIEGHVKDDKHTRKKK